MAEKKDLKLMVAELPETSGVYIMKNKAKKVLYVGKARSLKKRVLSYFRKNTDIKTFHLISHVDSIEFIVTGNEYEALLVENSLIKKWNPKYNISLKDGKTYPVIRITHEAFPKIYRTRYIVNDGSLYFGPYPNVKQVDLYLDIIKVLFPLRRCKTLNKRDNPCLYYHIKECSAPCCGKIDEKEYGKYISRIKNLLSGKIVLFEQELRKQMKIESETLNFEKAAKIRDTLTALLNFTETGTIEDYNEEKRDFAAYIRSGSYYIFSVLEMRGGTIAGQNLYGNEYWGEEEEALADFLVQYYGDKEVLPSFLFVPDAESPLIKEYFQKEKNNQTEILVPRNNQEQGLMKMARENAAFELDRRMKKTGHKEALEELKDVLGLLKVPRVIEGFDIAQLHGKFTVASLIAFKDGYPDRKNYRHFRIQSLKGKIDDFKAVSEAVSRRYTRLLNEEKPLPDLIMIDGGKGQVNAAYSILSALELSEKIPVIGLAKKEEIIYFPGDRPPLDLPEGDDYESVAGYDTISAEELSFGLRYEARFR